MNYIEPLLSLSISHQIVIVSSISPWSHKNFILRREKMGTRGLGDAKSVLARSFYLYLSFDLYLSFQLCSFQKNL